MQPGMQAELDKVVTALGEFYAREIHLLENDLGERTLTHRLRYIRKSNSKAGTSTAIMTG